VPAGARQYRPTGAVQLNGQPTVELVAPVTEPKRPCASELADEAEHTHLRTPPKTHRGAAGAHG